MNIDPEARGAVGDWWTRLDGIMRLSPALLVALAALLFIPQVARAETPGAASESEDGGGATEDDDADSEDDEDDDAPAGGGDSVRSWRGGGPFALGFTVGTINGASMRIWPARLFAIGIEAGTTTVLNTLAVGLSGRFHLGTIQIPDSPVSIHPNVGPRFRTRMAFGAASPYVEIGGGAVVGAVVVVRDVPIEIFFDVAPNVGGSVTSPGFGRGFDVDGLVGLRYAF